MKKIMFLNPPFSAGQLYGELSEGGSELPLLGIALLAAIVRDHGYRTSILDAAALRLDHDTTVEKIIAESPDVLGISSTTITIYNASHIARMLKDKGSQMKIVIGGPHVTCCPDETMSVFPEFDIGVVGEGEKTILELLKCFETNSALNNCKGLMIRHNGSIMFTGSREYVEDLDQLPFPAWDLLPDLVKYYQPAADSLYRFPATLLVTSRGCPGQCIFCEKSMFGSKIRGYSAGYIVRMIEHLQKNYRIKDIFFEDDNFFVFKKRTKEFCDLLKEKKLDISFSVMGRADNVTPEILKMLKEAGCWQVGYGCESGSQKILDNINKNITIETLENALKMTHKVGLKIKGLFMLGNPGETRESINQTLQFIKRTPLDDFHIFFFTPYPGTQAAKMANSFGVFDPDWRKANLSTPDNFIPFGFTYEELLFWHKKAYRIFYLRPKIIIYFFFKMIKDRKLLKKIIKSAVSFMKYTMFNQHKMSCGNKALEEVPSVTWDNHWKKLLSKNSFFGRLIISVRFSVISKYVSYLIDKYFTKEGLFLEAGCGTAQTSFRINKLQRRFIALDFSLVALKQAAKINVVDEVVLGDINSLPFPDESLDGLWNIGVMEHFHKEDLIKIYNEFARVLKKGGVVIALIPPVFASHIILLTPIERIISLFKGKPFKFFPDEFTRIRGRRHLESIFGKTKLKIINTHFSWRDCFFFCAVIAKRKG